MRESMWVVPSNPVDQARKFFTETSDLGEDDRILGEEETIEYRVEVKGATCRHRRKGIAEKGERPRPRATNGVARHI
jgi:CTD kinase subunit gamma